MKTEVRRSSGLTNPRLFLARFLAFVLFLVCTSCLAAPSFGTQQIFKQTYPLSPGGRFVLQNVTGSVRVDGWERNEVEVRAVKIANNDARDLGQVTIEVETLPHEVLVHTRYPRGGNADVAVDYQIYVPFRVLLSEVETVNGSVVIHGVAGGGDLRSVNGDVEVLKSSGRFNAKTTNGNLRVEFSELRDGAPMNLETVNGSVVLALPSTARANLTVLNMNGDFSSELPVNPTAPRTAHTFHAKLGLGGGEISLRTINGGVRLIREPNL